VTQAAWPPPAAAMPGARASRVDIAAKAAAVFVLLIYSQAWVFPLMGPNPTGGEGGLIRAIFLPAYAGGFALLLSAPVATSRALLRQPLLVLLLLICAASATWSIAPDETARRVFALYCTTLGGAVIAARFTWAELAEACGATFLILGVGSVLAALLVPSMGVMPDLFPGAWRGLWSEKNALGGNMAFGFACILGAAALNPQQRLLWSGAAVLALGLVLASTSTTSLLCLLLALAGFVFVALVRRGRATSVGMVWLAVVALMILAGAALFASDVLLGVLGKDATLTGRTKIWAGIVEQVRLRPWTGYGYGVVWNVTGNWAPLHTIVKRAGFTPIHAHSVWFEQWLALGVVGLAAFTMFYVQTLAAAVLALFRSRGAYLAIPFLVVYTLMSFTESIAVAYNDLRWVLLVAIAVKLGWPGRDSVSAAARPVGPRPRPGSQAASHIRPHRR
jgi:exopolysaccharide production protein ExoQ